MNRYNRGPTIGGPSKATASTVCQKCLKKDNYECKAVAQERPYVSRPSRTQQLMNPKLVPKLTSDVPQDLLRKKGVADEQLAQLELERGRKRDRTEEDQDALAGSSKRMRSASSVSVSTISTRTSRSQSPLETLRESKSTKSVADRASLSQSPSPPVSTEKKRRRKSVSSVDSHSSDGKGDYGRASRERTNSRSTRRRFQQHSPPARGRQYTSRSPRRDGRRRLSNDRQRVSSQERSRANDARPPSRPQFQNKQHRERSLSPFSKRLALTQAMNTTR